jgi:membrane-associated phospholipid phosphatase
LSLRAKASTTFQPPASYFVLLVCVVLATFGQARAAAQTAVAPNVAPLSRLGLAEVLRRVGHDQASIWGFPLKALRGSHANATVPFVAATVALVMLDPHDTPYFRRTDQFDTFNHDLSGANTGLGEGLFPIAVWLVGEIRDDSYTTDSAWLAAEALLDTETVAEVSKAVTRRLKPSDIPRGGDFGRTWFRAPGAFPSVASFPSGHASGAFALAAVISARYRDHRWVPWVAYSVATLIGVSRITLQSHFPSDVFTGGVLGGVIGHAVAVH